MENESRILLGLMARGLPPHIAQGVTANMIAESRLNPGINEAAPLVPGSRGGFGLNQWTGPRRRAIEAEAQRRGVPVDDLDFQLDYTMEELQGPERRAYDRLMGAGDAVDAARIYSESFLRPGIPHMDRRVSEAARLSGQPMPQAGGQQPSGGETFDPFAGQQNVLAQSINSGGYVPMPGQQQAPPQEDPRNALSQYNMDPRAFMSQRSFMPQGGNALAQQYQPHYLTRGRA